MRRRHERGTGCWWTRDDRRAMGIAWRDDLVKAIIAAPKTIGAFKLRASRVVLAPVLGSSSGGKSADRVRQKLNPRIR